MNEEIEYAEMLEIPVSTVNVAKKRRKNKKTEQDKPLKDTVIEQVNDKLQDAPLSTETEELADVNEGELRFDSDVERIDTVRVYSADEERNIWEKERLQDEDRLEQDETRVYGTKRSRRPKLARIVLGGEFAACCALCGAIFLTNVFVPGSAINTFFRALNNPPEPTSDKRVYSDFTLTPVVGEYSDAKLTLSPAGILSFTDEGCVYPAVDGKVQEVTKNADGAYTVKIAHSDSFTEVMVGLDYVYYAVGEEVKANVPVGYSEGEKEVQVTMYSEGKLLNCFRLSDENELSWVVSES